MGKRKKRGQGGKEWERGTGMGMGEGEGEEGRGVREKIREPETQVNGRVNQMGG